MILASKSPRRKEILEEFGFNLQILTEEVVEESEEKDPFLWAIEIAKKKAEAVSKNNKDQWILAADTVVIYNDEFFGKPKDENEAFEMLKKLSGKKHQVITGVVFLNNQKNIEICFADKTEVYFKNLDFEEIKWYVDTKDSMDKAGSYGIQGKGSIFIERIEGDFFNVMGFPISKFYDKLKELKINIEELHKL